MVSSLHLFNAEELCNYQGAQMDGDRRQVNLPGLKCGNCGEVSEAAVLCPSFYRADIVSNPSIWDRFISGLRGGVISWLQARRDTNRLQVAL